MNFKCVHELAMIAMCCSVLCVNGQKPTNILQYNISNVYLHNIYVQNNKDILHWQHTFNTWWIYVKKLLLLLLLINLCINVLVMLYIFKMINELFQLFNNINITFFTVDFKLNIYFNCFQFEKNIF